MTALPQILIRLTELRSDGNGAFSVIVSFGDDAEYEVTVTGQADEAREAELAWYFEEHLRYPFLDKDREQQAVQQITDYGEALFGQVFGGAADHDYRSLRERAFDRCRIEISGSAALHQLHWEAMRDPDLDSPLAVRMPMTRRVKGQPSRFALSDPRPTLNIMVVTARPDGPRDVGYRTISRPLLEALRTAGLPVTVDLVRPGTWDALREHLQSATKRHGSGWYHIVHFDLHGAFVEHSSLEAGRQAGRLLFSPATLAASEERRGFLFFETAQVGKAQPVSAESVASLLAEHRVPVAVLNACQSAMQSDSEAGLAQRLAEAGLPVAVGMAYSVTVSAAERAMPVLYRGVADGEDLTAAVTTARRDLQEHHARRAYFGQELDLEDWMLPVMFGQRPLRIDLRPMTDPELAGFYERQAMVADEPVTEYGFVGRDLDIQAIELRLLAAESGGQLLIQGMAGAGKSTLLAHLVWWWQRTGMVDHAFRYSYEDRAWTAGQIIRHIRSQLLSPAEHTRADTLSEDAQAEQVAGLLRATRHLLILDNAESITAAPPAIPHALESGERDKLGRFLARLRGGRTLVLLGSRGTEDWLTGGQGPGIYPLPGLDPQAASLLVDKVLVRHGAHRWLEDDTERHALQELVTLLGGYPLPLTVVLPTLAITSPSRVLGELRAGGLGADPAGLIRRAIEYSHGKLDPALQNSLQLLAPFTAVIGTGPLLDRYQELLSQQEAVEALGTVDLPTALDQAVSVGLAAPHPQLTNLVQVQPVLPWFLRSRLHSQPDLRMAVDQAHYQFHCELGLALYVMLTSPDDPQRRLSGMAGTHAQYANLRAALSYGLRTSEPIATLVGPLDEYLDQAQQHDARRQLLEESIAEYPDSDGRDQQRQLAQLHDFAGATAIAQRRFDDAIAHYEAALRLLQAAGQRQDQATAFHQLGLAAQEQRRYTVAEANYRAALEIDKELGELHRSAMTYHQLGRIAEDQHRYGEAEANYRKALDTFLSSGDLRSTALSHHHLGVIAQVSQQYAEAEASYIKSIEVSESFGDRYSTARSYGQLGHLAYEQGRVEDAEASFRKALDIFVEFADRFGEATTHQNLGNLARMQGRLEEAEARYSRALEIFLQVGDQRGTALSYSELGKVFCDKKEAEQSETNLRRALDIFLELNEREDAAKTYSNLGTLAMMLERFEEAEDSYRKSLEICVELDEQEGAASMYQNLGNIARIQERPAEAELSYRGALEILSESDPRSPFIATQLGIVLAQLGRHHESIAMILHASIARRRATGEWNPKDLEFLHQERALVDPADFIALADENIPTDLLYDFTAAIEA